MRIVPLSPSTTETLCGGGAGADVVGVTFECDYPAEARDRRIVSTSSMPEGMGPREIDGFVAAALSRGEDLYRLSADALRELNPDVLVTQDLCAVCAVDVSVVEDALKYLGCRADVVTMDPHNLSEVFDSVLVLGSQTNRVEAARELVASMNSRVEAVRLAVAASAHPRVLVLEWTDPPFAPGHWIPEMVEIAGGVPMLGTAGEKSYRVTWEQVEAAEPDVVVCAPCGFDLEGSVSLSERVRDRFPGIPVWAVDANASFARPGPRLVDGIEALAGILNPGLVPARDDLAQELRKSYRSRGRNREKLQRSEKIP